LAIVIAYLQHPYISVRKFTTWRREKMLCSAAAGPE
jgi:hypothetical protein